MRISPPSTTARSTALVTVGIYLIPLAGIALFWHAHTTRLLIKSRTPSPSAIPDGLQLVSRDSLRRSPLRGDGIGRLRCALEGFDECSAAVGRLRQRRVLAVGYGMVFIYALRGAGMYALTTTY